MIYVAFVALFLVASLLTFRVSALSRGFRHIPGEIAAVFDHEWGHGMDANDATPGIASPSGEGCTT